MPLPIIYARPQGRSATFAMAQANATSSSLGEFLLTRVKNYGVVTVAGETIEASKGNEYAFLEALTTETDLGLKTLGDRYGTNEYGILGRGQYSEYHKVTHDNRW